MKALFLKIHKNSMFIHLKDIIPHTINKMGLRRQTEAAHICQIYRRIAPSVFGSESCLNFTKPKCFKNSILYIGVKNSAWGQMVFINRRRIIEAINKELKNGVITDLRTEIKMP